MTSSNITVRRGYGRRVLLTETGFMFTTGQHSQHRLFSLTVDNEAKGKTGAVFVTVEQAPYEVSVRGKPSRYFGSSFETAARLPAGRKTKLRVSDMTDNTWTLRLGNSGQVLTITKSGEDVVVSQSAPEAQPAEEVPTSKWFEEPRTAPASRGFAWR
jgi:hypothetical protein